MLSTILVVSLSYVTQFQSPPTIVFGMLCSLVLLEIVSMDIAGSTASVRVRDGYIGHVFLDTLSFLETNGEWKIYNKLFHVES